MQASDDALVGQVVEDRYQIEGPLGQGGMGVVYRARHIQVGREVAIKVLRADLTSDPLMVERFEREAAIAARLSHRNLVGVIDIGYTASHQRLMVLELARGETLAAMIARGALPRDRVIALTAQLLAGLDHAHAAGLVHRDLKPDNVIVEIDRDGVETPRIVDFGLALLRGEERRLTSAGVVLGTPQYMAPEHAQGHAVDPRCDLFALGVMVYEMLGGVLPFDGTGVEVALANITRDPPALIDRAGIAVDPLLEAFVRRLMARRARDRFQSARAAADVLELIDAHRAAAFEILLAARPAAPRLTAVGSVAPANAPAAGSGPGARPQTFAARAVEPQPGARVFAARSIADPRALGLAATLEADPPARSRRRRRRKRPQPLVRWQPWKSFGLLAGAAAALLTLAVIALVAG